MRTLLVTCAILLNGCGIRSAGHADGLGGGIRPFAGNPRYRNCEGRPRRRRS